MLCLVMFCVSKIDTHPECRIAAQSADISTSCVALRVRFVVHSDTLAADDVMSEGIQEIHVSIPCLHACV